jgi:ATP-dependent RNA helicase DeaD
MSSETNTTFAQLGLSVPVLKAVEEVGYETPSPIQLQSIPPLLAGNDLLGQAQTGTGKTAAFALPMLSRLDASISKPQVLVLTPTRELAIQVAEAMQTYSRHIRGFHILPVYGGQPMGIQLRQLSRGVHVVVGTPGRVMDHIRRKTLVLDNLSGLVLDEADEMLNMGFIEDIEWILEHTPEQKQTALFSATMPPQIKRVAKRYLNDPVEIQIKSKTSTVDTITQRYWQVTGLHKLDALTRMLEVEEFDAMLVFVRTKTATLELAEKLLARGYSSAALNGDMNQAARENTVARLKSGRLDIIVATDVAARGLDVERISHVINYDIPNDTEAYVHRIGRTGRAGRKGDAILFVSPREKRMLYAIERATKQKITQMQLPSHKDVTGRRVERFQQTITDAISSQDLNFFEELITDYQQKHNIEANQIAAALAYLNQQDRPLQVQENTKPAREASDRPVRHDKPRQERPSQERPRREKQHRDKPRQNKSYSEDRPQRDMRPRAESIPEDGMVRYRIEVGKSHEVMPKNIVGAIANEAGLDSQYIGRVSCHENHSTVDLPDGMPKDIFKHLKRVWVCGRQLNITLEDGAPEKAGDNDGKPRLKGTIKTRDKDKKKSAKRKPKAKKKQRPADT